MIPGRKIFRKALKTSAFLCVLILLAVPVGAQSPVDSGYYEFSAVDGGGRDCRVKDWHVACGVIDWIPDLFGVNPWVAFLPITGLTPLEPFPYGAIRTLSNPSTKTIGAAFTNFGFLNVATYDQFGIPHHATSWLYKDIRIEDPSSRGNFVDVQISITHTWEGGIVGGGNYEGRISLSVEMEDITDAVTGPTGIGSFDLVSRDRSGDQGITDISAGGVTYDRNNDTNHFLVKLQRGRSYRIYFKAEAYGSPLVASGIESSIRARLDKIGVGISIDAADQIAIHDAEIKAALAAHDEKIAKKLAVQEKDIKDIKEMLQGMMVNLEEIKRLLITPQGRREGFPLKAQ